MVIYEILGRFQKYYTKNEQTVSIMSNILWLQYINYALVPLVTKFNIKIPFLNELGLFDGPYTEFTVKWYQDVGATMCFTMLINCVSPHIGKIAKPIIVGLLRCMDRGCKCRLEKDGKVFTKKVL